MSEEAGPDGKQALKTLALENNKPQPETFLEDIRYYELSLDGKKVLVRKADDDAKTWSADGSLELLKVLGLELNVFGQLRLGQTARGSMAAQIRREPAERFIQPDGHRLRLPDVS